MNERSLLLSPITTRSDTNHDSKKPTLQNQHQNQHQQTSYYRQREPYRDDPQAAASAAVAVRNTDNSFHQHHQHHQNLHNDDSVIGRTGTVSGNNNQYNGHSHGHANITNSNNNLASPQSQPIVPDLLSDDLPLIVPTMEYDDYNNSAVSSSSPLQQPPSSPLLQQEIPVLNSYPSSSASPHIHQNDQRFHHGNGILPARINDTLNNNHQYANSNIMDSIAATDRMTMTTTSSPSPSSSQSFQSDQSQSKHFNSTIPNSTTNHSLYNHNTNNVDQRTNHSQIMKDTSVSNTSQSAFDPYPNNNTNDERVVRVQPSHQHQQQIQNNIKATTTIVNGNTKQSNNANTTTNTTNTTNKRQSLANAANKWFGGSIQSSSKGHTTRTRSPNRITMNAILTRGTTKPSSTTTSSSSSSSLTTPTLSGNDINITSSTVVPLHQNDNQRRQEQQVQQQQVQQQQPQKGYEVQFDPLLTVETSNIMNHRNQGQYIPNLTHPSSSSSSHTITNTSTTTRPSSSTTTNTSIPIHHNAHFHDASFETLYDNQKNDFLHSNNNNNTSQNRHYNKRNNNNNNNNNNSKRKRRKYPNDGWNLLNLILFLSYGLTTAAATVPIILIPTIAMDLFSNNNNNNNNNDDEDDEYDTLTSLFASRVATYAVLGTSLGKFLNGPMGDIFGARRISCLYALLLTTTLFLLSFARGSSTFVMVCCAAVEFFQSVQWPCIAVILAAHYNGGLLDDDEDEDDGDDDEDDDEDASLRKVMENENDGTDSSYYSTATMSLESAGKYEAGVYVASLGSRFGSLLTGFLTTILLRYEGWGWRLICRFAAFSSFVGFGIMYLFATDSPGKLHDPQNPIRESFPDYSIYRPESFNMRTHNISMIWEIERVFKFLVLVIRRNVVPSLRSVLSSGTFWIVAIAHSGGSMIITSVRILGIYFRDTSYGTISENEAGAVTVFLSVGIFFGLGLGGKAFAALSANAAARKVMITRLYILTVSMCYTLALLAIPIVRQGINAPSIVAFFQATATFFMGASVAVQVFCIPAIVGSTFGANKGLYAAYTDGVAYAVSSIVWRIVGNAVEEGHPQGSGWAYGWAAVALLVIFAGLLMVEFVEHYFCKAGWMGRIYQTTIHFGGGGGTATTASSGVVAPLTKPEKQNSSFISTAQSNQTNENVGFVDNLFRPSPNVNEKGQKIHSMLSLEEDDESINTSPDFEDPNSELAFTNHNDDEFFAANNFLQKNGTRHSEEDQRRSDKSVVDQYVDFDNKSDTTEDSDAWHVSEDGRRVMSEIVSL